MGDILKNGRRYDARTFNRLERPGITLESAMFYDCAIKGSKFTGTLFRGCRWVNVRFYQCDLSLARVPGSSFSGCLFEECKMTGVDWTEADWVTPLLSEPISFIGTDLSHSTFLGITMPESGFLRCRARDVDFREADFRRSRFTDTDLSESLFGSTNLSEADFIGARDYHINPMDNTLTGAKFALPEALELLYALDIRIVDTGPFQGP